MTDMPKLKDHFGVISYKSLPGVIMYRYWKDLEKANTLKYRWSDMGTPTALSVIDRAESYFIYDIQELKVIGEFALESFTGKAAQIHFSMHPDNTTEESINICTKITDTILNEWKSKDKSPYLNCLFGLISVSNRVASLFVRKVGFKKVFILPSGTNYLNEVTDAVVLVKERIYGR